MMLLYFLFCGDSRLRVEVINEGSIVENNIFPVDDRKGVNGVDTNTPLRALCL